MAEKGEGLRAALALDVSWTEAGGVFQRPAADLIFSR